MRATELQMVITLFGLVFLLGIGLGFLLTAHALNHPDGFWGRVMLREE